MKILQVITALSMALAAWAGNAMLILKVHPTSQESEMGVAVKDEWRRSTPRPQRPKPQDQQRSEPEALFLKTCVDGPCGGDRKVQPGA